jgi:peptide/nickel transport system permease protein
MTAYLIRRFIIAVAVIWLVTIIVFLAVRILPGNPVLMYVSFDQLKDSTDAQIAQLEHEFGLDRPLLVQYFSWLGGLFKGDMGMSISQRTPISKLIASRLPITMHLSLLAIILAVLIGIPAGVICAVRRGRWMDTLLTIMANLGITIPAFFLGIMFIYGIGYKLQLLPLFGYTSPFTDFWLSTKQLIMPVVCLALFPLASITRQTRSSMLEVTRQDYIRTAWAKGLKERVVVTRHALKNGLIPVITLVGISLRDVVGGSVLVEVVFNIPGMGRLGVNAALAHDYPVIQGFILLISIMVVFTTLIVDISYSWFDPRIKYD